MNMGEAKRAEEKVYGADVVGAPPERFFFITRVEAAAIFLERMHGGAASGDASLGEGRIAYRKVVVGAGAHDSGDEPRLSLRPDGRRGGGEDRDPLMIRNYFKLSLKRDYDRYKRGGDGGAPLAVHFFNDRDLSAVQEAYGELVESVVKELRRGASRADLLVSVWRRPDWEGPWESVAVVGAFGFGEIVDEGRAA